MQISEFLSRPKLIANYEWRDDTVFEHDIRPYSLFLDSDYVKRKIANYKFFRGDMKLKVVFNGTPFNYGLMQISYVPRIRAMNSYPASATETDKVFHLMGYSQNPVVYADLNENSSVEISIPFFYPHNYIDLARNSLASLAKVRLREMIGGLSKASTEATSKIDVSVFAWIENPELAGPTMFELQSSQLSGATNSPLKETNVDEYKEDSISTISYAVSKATGALKNVPVVGPYALATSMGAKKFGDVAKYYGFSRPPQLHDMNIIKTRTQAPMANVLGADTVYKLTYDPKQETTIDTQVTGIPNNDDMLLSTIFGRESYIGTIDWDMTDDYPNTLGYVRVSPVVCRQDTGTPANEGFKPTVFSSLGFGALPFQYWSGSIDYRIKVVASKYHKGRLRVSYDPHGNAPGSEEHNPISTYIIDLDTCREVKLRVSWCSSAPYLEIGDYDDGALNGVPAIDTQPGNCNGTFFIEVLNQLSAPSSTADVKIHVFHKGGPDFEVFNPRPSSFGLWGPGMATNYPEVAPESYALPASDNRVLLELQSDGFASCTEDQTIQLIGEPDVDLMEKKALIFHGDPVNSLRQILKRYEFHTVGHATQTQNSSNETFLRTVFHPYPTYNNFTNRKEGHSDPSFPTSRNNCPTSLLAYFTAAYAGYRGGLRFKLFTKVQSGNIGTTRIFRTGGPVNVLNGYTDSTYIFTAPNGSNESLLLGSRYGWYGGAAGCISYNATHEPVGEFEVPYYASTRFLDVPIPEDTRNDNSFPINYDQVRYQNVSIETELNTGFYSGNLQGTHRLYAAAAEDYNLVWYLGCPYFCMETI